MNKFIYHKVLPFVCALSILVFLLVVPASAASGVGKDTGKDTANRDAWASYITSTDPVFGDLFSKHFNVDVGYRIFFRIIDDVVGRRYGEVDLDELNTICVQLNEAFCNKPISDLYSFVDVTSAIANYTLMTCFRIPNMRFEVVAGGATAGYYRIKDNVSGLYVVNAVGLYPCTPIDGEFTDTDKHNHWVAKDSAEKNLRYSQVMTGADMRQLCTTLQVAGEPAYVGNFGTKYKAIFRDGREVYANPDGYPFVSAADDSEWAVNQPRPDAGVKDENGNDVEELPEENMTGIDLSGMTITLPDGSINFIDKIIYDESTKSYHIDSHDTYNYEINNYYTWNYYINYTSITYIGQTEEYNKYYEVYYELPDGRDSADLTKEDLEQLNLSVDVIPYGRSADDTSLRSLYHFDGDTKDSSYWNYCTDFTWNKGASLTYMDAGVFDGALYLDETEHDFTLTLPSSVASGDFSLQFRYYQSATAAPQTDSYIQLGSFTAMQFNGAHLFNSSGSTLSSVPIGSWNEIALIRSSGILYYYLNGVCIGSVGFTNAFSNKITFHFGSAQQTFKYFDELRVLNYPLAFGGSYYECTSVPHDTNLTLVLPDSTVPVADEYIKWTTETNPTLLYNFESASLDFVLRTSNPQNNIYSDNMGFWTNSPNFTVSYDTSDSGLMLSRVSGGSGSQDFGGLWFNLVTMANSNQVFTVPATLNFYYYFDDYAPCKVTLSAKSSSSGVKFTLSHVDDLPSNVQIAFVNDRFLLLRPSADGGNLLLKRIEFRLDGSNPSVAEKITSITLMDKSDLNTPTLAVRTDIDITSYQIGGVRPSLPTKGQVWAMVENDRIVSIQIYNGQAWEGVDGRIWTGQRWIPASSYNIITLQDMYDIVDATPNYEYIYSEAGFWAWWQKSWNAFQEKLFQALGSGGSGSGSIVPGTVKQKVSEALSSLIEGIFGTITEVLKSLIGAASDLLSGIFSFFSDTVFGGIRDFFSSFDELINPFETTIENEDGSTTTSPGLPDDVVTGLGFFSGLIMLIPDEVRVVLFFFAGLTLFIAILKRFA